VGDCDVLLLESELCAAPAVAWAKHRGAAVLKVKRLVQSSAATVRKFSRKKTRADNFSVVGANLALLVCRNSVSLLIQACSKCALSLIYLGNHSANAYSYFEHKPFANTKHIVIVKGLNQTGNRALPTGLSAGLPMRIEEVGIAGRT
jgi:hypothetical protein